MKKLAQYIVLAYLLFLGACKKLEEYNPSNPTAEETWSTPEGYVMLVNGCYSVQREWYGKEDGLFMSESGTDLWFNESKSSYARQLTKYEGLTPQDGNPNKAAWRLLYKGINQCNAGVGRIDQAGFTDSTEKHQRLAEVRFLRGFYYWHLVETYGGVILRTTETQEPLLTAQRSSVEDCYELIINDLQYAAENLPDVQPSNEYGRASKKAAYGFLARACLSRAYYSSGSAANEWYTKARDAATNVIDNQATYRIALWENYADLWNPDNNRALGQIGGEALYVVANSTNYTLNIDANGNRLHAWFMEPYSSKAGLVQSIEYGYTNQRRLMPTYALLQMYDTMDTRYESSFQEVWIANTDTFYTQEMITAQGKDASLLNHQIRAGVDTAMLITRRHIADEATRPYLVIDVDSVYNTAANNAIRNGIDFVVLKKFLDYNRTVPSAQQGFNDVIVMRLSEMYLIAAEAELQLGNPSQAASYINVLRTRAARNHTGLQVTAGDIDIDFILDERARELAGEYIRWFDLKRTGKLVDRISTQGLNPDITAVKEFHKLRPIPQNEIDALSNGASFPQNPGYF